MFLIAHALWMNISTLYYETTRPDGVYLGTVLKIVLKIKYFLFLPVVKIKQYKINK